VHEVLTNIARDMPELNYYQGMNYVCIFLWHTIRGTHPNLNPLESLIAKLRHKKERKEGTLGSDTTLPQEIEFVK
jgi:hypothetical protein